MNHYPHHIGDFDKATRHLNRIERSVYRDLIELYYDTEQRLTLDIAVLCRKILARSNEESTAVEQVLNEFFQRTETGWYQSRCEREIEVYRTHSSQKAIAGRASAAARAAKRQQDLNEKATAVQQPLDSVATAGNGTPTNREPLTINQEPLTKKEKKPAQAQAAPLEIPVDLLSDFMGVRKAKKAGPLTGTAIKGLQREARKAGLSDEEAVTFCVEAGWQTFNAGWHAERTASKPTGNTGETAYQRSMRLRVAEVSPLLARAAPGAEPAQDATAYFQTVQAIGVNK